MRYTVFDIETDGLLEEVTKIHCLHAQIFEDKEKVGELTFRDPIAMVNFLKAQEILVGHNIVLYDLPVFKKLIGYEHTGRVIDTLALSWYLYPDKKEHGLDHWGEVIGIQKPKIDDWTSLTVEEYIHRCTEDVKINSTIFENFIRYLLEIYDENGHQADRIIQYLTWKLDCAKEQMENPLIIDRDYCQRTLDELSTLIEERKSQLREAMPKVVKFASKKKPAKMYTVKNELTKAGVGWLELLHDNDLPPDFEGEVQVVKSNEDPNPTSIPQLKSWLFSLGWKPTVFNYVADTKNIGSMKAVPQLQDKEKNLCVNIDLLSETHPSLKALKGLFMLQHRIGILNGFLECSDDQGNMVAEIAGFTNTLRFRHRKPLVNLPSVDKPYGKHIRGAIIAPEGHLFCGSDMSSLEDTTKQHYMYFYDPDYVLEMRTPGFDPHVQIAVLAGILSKEDEEFYKLYDKSADNSEEDILRYLAITYKRKLGKIVNFSGIYGAGPPKISQTTGMSLELATQLHTAYWDRNKSVKWLTNDTVYKSVREQMWLYNPVSGFWYSLRKPKDRFSTLNQGTGVYCFDTHIRNVRSTGIKIRLQYHDEIGFIFPTGDEERVKFKLNLAIERTNETLKLNIPLGISIDIGHNYAESH